MQIELNSPGTFSAVVPIFNKAYNQLNVLKSTVEVFENDTLIWYGRITDIYTDIFQNKEITCEGAMAFLNDSIQRPKTYLETTIHDFFKDVIATHNSQVPENRRFAIGRITIDDYSVVRQLNYEPTIDVINSMCLDIHGGYLFFRRENGINYIDWLQGMPSISNQPIEFGKNLIDISEKIYTTDIKTAIIPLGAEYEETGDRLTIKEVNDGLDYLVSEYYAEKYGEIFTTVVFDDIYDADDLKAAGEKWLVDAQFDHVVIECSAAELSHINSVYSPYIVGQTVHVKTNGIDKIFPLTKLSINLDSAKKNITLGSLEDRELTKIYNE